MEPRNEFGGVWIDGQRFGIGVRVHVGIDDMPAMPQAQAVRGSV